MRLERDRRSPRRVSVIPRRCGPIPGATLVDEQLLALVQFSDHALERFAERAGLPRGDRASLEAIARDLLLQEGLRVPRPPRWAHVRAAPFYLQAGSWLLFIGRPCPRRRDGRKEITTVISARNRSWAAALSHGDIATPSPLRVPAPTGQHVALRQSVAAALGRRYSPLGFLRAVAAIHRERRENAELRFAGALRQWETDERMRTAARQRARARHLSRHGFAE